MSKARKALEAKVNAASKDKSLIGAIASCTARDVSMSYDDLENLCKAVGLDQSLWPVRPSCKKAFSKAIKETKRESTGFLFRAILSGPTEKVVGVVNEKKLMATRDLNYSMDARLILDKVNEAVKVELKDKAGHGARCQKLFKKMFTTVLSRDVKEWFRKTLRYQFDAVKLADEGTSYFVTPNNVEGVMRIQAVIDAIGTSQAQGSADPRTHANVFCIADAYDNKGKAAISVKAGLLGELEKLQLEIQEWQANPPRLDTMERRMEEYGSMQKRVAMFVKMLDINAGDLTQGLKDCEKMVAKLLGATVKEIGEEGMEKRQYKREYREKRQQARAAGDEILTCNACGKTLPNETFPSTKLNKDCDCGGKFKWRQKDKAKKQKAKKQSKRKQKSKTKKKQPTPKVKKPVEDKKIKKPVAEKPRKKEFLSKSKPKQKGKKKAA